MWQRIGVYIGEMYPPLPSLLISLFSFFNVFFLAEVLAGYSPLIVSGRAVLGALTLFLFLLFLRISDELKDSETDKRLFPHRPLPSGRVLLTDLQFLMKAVVALMFGMNVLMGPAFLAFLLLFGFGLLMLKYFFIPHLISRSLLLALITHNPSVIFMNLYVLAIFATEHGWQSLPVEIPELIILFWLPGLAWELSRKIRCPADENEYETYSRIYGYRLATVLPMAVLLSHYFLLAGFAQQFHFHTWFLWLIEGSILLVLNIFLIFMLRPTRLLAGRLKPVTEAYMLVTALSLLVELVWGRALLWKL